MKYFSETLMAPVMPGDVHAALGGNEEEQLEDEAPFVFSCEETKVAEEEGADKLLKPRSESVLWKNLLQGCRIRKRPETKFCKPCRALPAVRRELEELSTALTSTHDCERWGSAVKAEARQKELQALLPELLQHEKWLETQRAAVHLSEFLKFACTLPLCVVNLPVHHASSLWLCLYR